jgi:hypothetical protein
MTARAAKAILLLYGVGMVLCIVALLRIGAARAEGSSPGIPDSWWNLPEIRKCCSEADAIFADDWTVNPDGSIDATVTAPGPRTGWAPIGRRYRVPAEKVVREPGNPTGRPILFLNQYDLNRVYCFAMGAGI